MTIGFKSANNLLLSTTFLALDLPPFLAASKVSLAGAQLLRLNQGDQKCVKFKR